MKTELTCACCDALNLANQVCAKKDQQIFKLRSVLQGIADGLLGRPSCVYLHSRILEMLKETDPC